MAPCGPRNGPQSRPQRSFIERWEHVLVTRSGPSPTWPAMLRNGYFADIGNDAVDGWEHTIKIARLDDPIPGVLYPQLTEAKGRCPPEGANRRPNASAPPDMRWLP